MIKKTGNQHSETLNKVAEHYKMAFPLNFSVVLPREEAVDEQAYRRALIGSLSAPLQEVLRKMNFVDVNVSEHPKGLAISVKHDMPTSEEGLSTIKQFEDELKRKGIHVKLIRV